MPPPRNGRSGRTFQNMRGYYGVDYPTQVSAWSAGVGAPMSPFILLRGAQQGLYAGVSAPSTELVAWHTELRPGYGSSIDARVPRTRTIAGKDVADALRRGPRALHPARRDAHPDARRARGLPGRLAAGRRHLQGLARHLDEAAADPRLGARAARLAADPHQLARGRAAHALHRPGPRSARSAPATASRPSSWSAGTTAGRTRATPRTTPTRAWAPSRS